MRRNLSALLLGTGLIAASLAASAQQVFSVNCAAGETISDALARGDSRKPMAIQMQGACRENVVIARDDVTLFGGGGSVNAANASQATIVVRGSRVTIIGPVVVTGGLNAITVNGQQVVIQNATLQGAAEYGVVFSNGIGGVNNSRITNNGLAGVLLRAASVRLTGNEIVGNAAGIGINAVRNSSFSTLENTISGNGEGIVLTTGSIATLDGDTIGPNAEHGLELVTGSTASLVDVTITGNGGDGILLDIGSTATISGGTVDSNAGDGISLTSDSRAHLTNVAITQNHHGIDASFSQVSIEESRIEQNRRRGMNLFASSTDLWETNILNNGYDGIRGGTGSTVQISGGSIGNNAGFGVSMTMHGTLSTANAPVIKGNANTEIRLASASKLLGGYIDAEDGVGLGLDCADAESSWAATLNGSVSAGCTGY